MNIIEKTKPAKKQNPNDVNHVARVRAESRVSGYSRRGEENFNSINWNSKKERT